MAGRAVHGRLLALEVRDRLEQLVVDPRTHQAHVARDLLGALLVALPLAGDVAVQAVHAERAAEAHLHDVEQAAGRELLQHLDVLPHRVGRRVLPPGDLLAQGGEGAFYVEVGTVGGRIRRERGGHRGGAGRGRRPHARAWSHADGDDDGRGPAQTMRFHGAYLLESRTNVISMLTW